ncbi:MAG: hypothetical protein IIA62_00580, partial [Nitrospinae bacterium]|nr:hypothetical protein [Nitrospinota bacterium]
RIGLGDWVDLLSLLQEKPLEEVLLDGLRPKLHPFVVTDLFASGMYYYDDTFAFISIDEARELAPSFVLNEGEAFGWEPESGHADPSGTALAYSVRAREMGASVVLESPALDIVIEGGRVVAVTTVLLVGGGLYWIAPAAGGIDMNALGFRETLKAGGWIHAFGSGYGHVVSQMLPFLGFTVAYMVAVLALNTFVMTTLDTAVRITRFIVQEVAGPRVPVMLNKYVTTALVVGLAYLIGATDGWEKIWPIFGATNQLIAAVALFVISAYLIGVRRPAKYTLYPAIFMLITAVGALLWQGYRFFTAPEPNLFLGCASLTLVGLALFVGNEGIRVMRAKKFIPQPVPSEA